MFKRALSILFPSFASQEVKPNYQYFEQSNNQVEDDQRVSLAEMQSALDESIRKEAQNRPKHDNQFLDYLFGNASNSASHKELSEFVASKVGQLLKQPDDLLKDLPIMPVSLTTILNEIENKNFDTDKLISIIETEPSIAASVIQLANTPAYKRGDKEITDLKSAFMNMGTDGLYQGVIEGYLKLFVPQPNIYFKQFGAKVWQHTQQTAEYSRELSHIQNLEERAATAYFVGLIRNLGEMIIFQVMVEAFGHVHPDASPNSSAFKKLINFYAEKITYVICKYWQLPDTIVKAIALQLKIKSMDKKINKVAELGQLALCVYEADILSELVTLLENNMITETVYKQRCDKLLHQAETKNFAEMKMMSLRDPFEEALQ